MMEAMLQQALDERFGEGAFLVTGAGVGADDGRPASQGSLRALERRGIDFRRHRSRALTRDVVRHAWRIYAAEEYQVRHARLALPEEERGKVRLFAGEEIPDPLGSNERAYEAVAAQIERLVPRVVEEIARDLAVEEGAGARP